MPYQIDTAAGHYDLLDRVRRFAGGIGTHAAPTYSGTGNGTIASIDTSPDTVTETWTITVTDATTAGAETWSVSGSVSGSKTDATTGVAYDNGLLSFTITAGSTAFAVGDAFSVDTTQGALSAAGRAWAILRWDTSTDNHELILKCPGLSGTEEIYVGIQTYQDPNNDYYNLSQAAFTGFVQGNGFDQQPGISPIQATPLWNQDTPYWLLCNGQRLVLAAKVSTVYEHLYLGKFLPYATPGQYPYPVCVGGMFQGRDAKRWSETSQSMPYKGNRDQFRMRFADGSWRTPDIWPWSNGFKSRDTGGEYALMPATLHDSDPNIYGELDGVRHVSGFNNAVENTVTVGGTDHVVIQDVYRTGFNDYIALELS